MYDDGTISVDGSGIRIHRYALAPRTKRIEFDDIRSIHRFAVGPTTRWRLVGVGFDRRWFNWDAGRRHRPLGVSIDIGHFLQPTVTPADPDAFLAAFPERLVAR